MRKEREKGGLFLKKEDFWLEKGIRRIILGGRARIGVGGKREEER